jgi:NTE family protein
MADKNIGLRCQPHPAPAPTCEQGRERDRLFAAQHRGDRRFAVPQGRTPFEQIALLLQGGGALGAYQAGVYEALAEADLHPDWVAGISIGAINSAIIAGNPPKQRVDALREFWHAVSTSPLGIPYFRQIEFSDDQHQLLNQARAIDILLFGTPNLFVPRLPPPAIWPPGSPERASYYDNTPLRATLVRPY